MTIHSRLRRLGPLLSGFLMMAVSSVAQANLCAEDSVEDVHRQEARELESQAYSAESSCTSGSDTCYVGVRDYNAQVIACNRKRDVQPFKVGPINDVPMVHKAAGRHLDGRSESDRRFARDLPPRMVTGQIQYFGAFPKWYGYVLERDRGNWIVTTVMDFKWPKAEPKVVHLPIYLTTRLSTERGGEPLTRSVCRGASSGNDDEGMVVVDGANEACRVDRHRQLFAIDDGVASNVEYLDPALLSGPRRPVTEWIMHYWRGVIQQVWSRPDGSFQLRVLITDLAGQPGEMDEEDVDLFKKNDVVYELELHHNESRGNQMFRPVEVLGVKLYKAVYTGAPPTTVAHEFGHSLGLDDEYPQSKNPKEDRDCTALTGYGDLSPQWAYAMCDDWDPSGDWTNTTRIGQQTVKSVYPWLITQRYSIGNEIRHCKEDAQCNRGEYCKKPLLGVNRCVPAKALGDGCTADKQCASPAVCMPKPFGKCILEASKRQGEACINNKECMTGVCNGGICVCSEDTHCSNGYCDKGTVSIGANQCKAFKANDEGCTRAGQCASGRCYLGKCKPQDECSEDANCSGARYCDKGTLSVGVNQCVALKANDQSCTRAGQCASGRCYLGKCKPQDECQEDRDCRSNQYCDKGTAGIGRNVCKTDKALGDACSRAGQCASNCCKVHNFKLQCRPSSKCN